MFQGIVKVSDSLLVILQDVFYERLDRVHVPFRNKHSGRLEHRRIFRL